MKTFALILVIFGADGEHLVESESLIQNGLTQAECQQELWDGRLDMSATSDDPIIWVAFLTCEGE